jgi:hypothetical protein
MSRRRTKQRRAAQRRRHFYILWGLAKAMMSGLTTPARQWFKLEGT